MSQSALEVTGRARVSRAVARCAGGRGPGAVHPALSPRAFGLGPLPAAVASGPPEPEVRGFVAGSSSDAGSSYASHCTSIPSAVSTAAAKTTGGAPRSAVEVASGKKVHECHLLADACCFPKGPIQGKDKHVEEAVKMWARDCTKGGGGHGIRKAGPTFAKSRGCRLRFQCAKDPNRTEDCKWECSFEESATGWILVHAVWEHNGHALLASGLLLVMIASRS